MITLCTTIAGEHYFSYGEKFAIALFLTVLLIGVLTQIKRKK